MRNVDNRSVALLGISLFSHVDMHITCQAGLAANDASCLWQIWVLVDLNQVGVADYSQTVLAYLSQVCSKD